MKLYKSKNFKKLKFCEKEKQDFEKLENRKFEKKKVKKL